MTTRARGLETLAEHIDNLGPAEVEAELSPIMQYGRETPLVRIIGQSEIGPVINVLGSIRNAIHRVDDPEVASMLGSSMIKGVINGIEERDYSPLSAATATSLAEQAEQTTELVHDPKSKAFELKDISSALTDSSKIFISDGDRFAIAGQARDLINDAASAAIEVEDISDQSYTLAEVANTSASNSAKLVDVMRANSSIDQELINDLVDQPVDIYQQAVQATESISHPTERIQALEGIALSAARASAKTVGSSQKLSDRLAATSLRVLGEVIQAYTDKEGVCAKLSPAQKCKTLINLGAGLAKIIDEDFGVSGHDITVRAELERKTGMVFRSAQTINAKAMARRQNKLFAMKKYDVAGTSSSTTTAAGRLLKTNPKLAKELLGIGYEFALAEDETNTDFTRRRGGAVTDFNQTVRDIADGQQLETRFKVYSFYHSLKNGRPQNSDHSVATEYNARHFLTGIKFSSLPTKGLDLIDREFAEFVIEVASSGVNAGRFIQYLRLFDYNIKTPELKKSVAEKIKTMRAINDKANEPQSDTARKVQEVLGADKVIG